MKKGLLLIGIALCLLVISSYLFIPGKIYFSQSITVHIAKQGLHRSLFDESNWNKWWPGSIDSQNKSLLYKNFIYKIEDEKIEIVNYISRNKQ